MRAFSPEELFPLVRPFSEVINGKDPVGIRLLDPVVRTRLKASNTVIRHGTDGRILQYHIWDRVQPDIFDKRHFKYEVQHDAVGRYSGTATTNFAIQFYMNKVRLIHERDALISRIRTDLQALKIPGYKLEENKQAIFLIHRFAADTPEALNASLFERLFPLLNEVHPIFYKIMDAFNVPISKEERREIIQGRPRINPIDRDMPGYGLNPEFGRGVAPGLRHAVFERDKFTCQHCGARGTATVLHADHIIPFRHGGPTSMKNLQALCGPCNLRKSGRYEEELTYRRVE